MRDLWVVAALAGCAPGDEAPAGPTWDEVAPIVGARCEGCHRAGHIGPFPLEDAAQLAEHATIVRASIEQGSMPPWPPADGCTTYLGDRRLSDDERATVLAWLDAAAPADASQVASLPDALEWAPDLSIELPEAFTPADGADDYRCQLVRWPLDAPAYITGLRIDPGVASIAHHAILFAASADGAARYEALDAADPGPGWTCFGGPDGGDIGQFIDDLSVVDAARVVEGMVRGDVPEDVDFPFGVLFGADGGRWLGEWVPGVDGTLLPQGTGMRMDPGDVVIVQMHYNTVTAPTAADRSRVAFRVADAVDHPAATVPVMDLGWLTNLDLFGGSMLIPAGEPNVVHETEMATDVLTFAAARRRIGLDGEAPVTVRAVGHHMHQLGTSARVDAVVGGARSCLLDLPRWDFGWQGGYQLAEPVTLGPADAVHLRCAWDNSPENQLVIDGVQQEPRDVVWGDRTRDEMCLGILYVTGP